MQHDRAAGAATGPQFRPQRRCCVIGGGLAGLTVARELARRRWSVALIEAKRLAWNASGRNTGFVLPGFAERIDKVVERIGMPTAKALWALSQAGVKYVRDAIAELGIATIKQGRGWLDVSKVPATKEALNEIGLIGQEFGTRPNSGRPSASAMY